MQETSVCTVGQGVNRERTCIRNCMRRSLEMLRGGSRLRRYSGQLLSVVYVCKILRVNEQGKLQKVETGFTASQSEVLENPLKYKAHFLAQS